MKMADIRKYNPTNQYFKDNFQRFAGTKTKKGDLNNSDGSVTYDMGVLKRIEKNKILQNGWIVQVSDKLYHCSNDSETMVVPPCVESQAYYTPKETINVDVSLDKKNKIYKLLRMRLSSRQDVSVVQANGKLTLLSPSTSSILPTISDSKDEKKASSISLQKNSISLVGQIYVNETNLEEALNNTVTTNTATQMETLNTVIKSKSIKISFEHKYSQMPSLNLTNAHEEKLDYTYTFIKNDSNEYIGVNVYFSEEPTEQNINILVVGNP